MDVTLSVVIPAYNEERRLPQTIAVIVSYLEAQPYRSEVLVVDDGSTDRTAEVADKFAGATSRVSFKVLRNEHRGKGYTVRTGMLSAEGRYILFSDADLATPIEEWRKLHPFLESGDDVVIGSREGLGAQRIGEPWHRHAMGRIFNALVRVVALGGIEDTQCGFKAFTQPAAQRIFGALRLYGDDAREVRGAAVTAFDVEVLYLARKWGYSVREVPVTWRYGEETKVDPLRDSWRNFTDVLRVRWNALRGRYDERPLASSQ